MGSVGGRVFVVARRYVWARPAGDTVVGRSLLWDGCRYVRWNGGSKQLALQCPAVSTKPRTIRVRVRG